MKDIIENFKDNQPLYLVGAMIAGLLSMAAAIGMGFGGKL